MLINPAICLPSFWPISSTISMHSKSSLLTAVMISSKVGGFSAVRFDSMELSPLPILSNRMRCSADPEASVSRHPFLPQWHSISLSKTLTCPNSPENPDFPVYTFPSMMMPIPSPHRSWPLCRCLCRPGILSFHSVHPPKDALKS